MPRGTPSQMVPVDLLRRLIEARGLTITDVVVRVATAEGRQLRQGARGRGGQDHLYRRLSPSTVYVGFPIADRVISLGLGEPELWYTVPELNEVYIARAARPAQPTAASC